MLIDFRQLFPKWDIKPDGVLHIGANVGEEAPVYHEIGIKRVLWIEANPHLFNQLYVNVSRYQGQVPIMMCVGNETKPSVLHEANNAGQSSSVLELGTHKNAHPEVEYIGDIPVMMHRLDDVFQSLPGYNFLNIDLQGFELAALRGMGELLRGFKWAYLEVNKEPLYKGCVLVDQLDLFMLGYGFKRVETKWCSNFGWGDALYIR